MQQLLTFVTGCSCTGKTAVAEALRTAGVPNVHELDDAAPSPRAGHVPWLRWQAAEHVRHMLDDDDRAQRIVTGIVWPFSLIGEYVWLDAMKNEDVAIRFVLLDPPWATILERLEDRLADWDPEDRDEQIENNRRLQRTLRTQVASLVGGNILWTPDTDVIVSELSNFW